MLILLTSLTLTVFTVSIGYLIGRRNPGKSSLFTAGSILLLILIPATYFLPKLELTVAGMEQQLPVTSSTSFPIYQTLFYLWLAGTVILLSKLGLHYLAVNRWRRNSERCTSPEWTHRLHECCSQLKMDTIPSLSLCEEISSPVVTGLVYPQILLPSSSKDWSEETINFVLLHELGHVKRRDLWISVASHIACALHWFNPLVWILRKQQVTQCEFACDSFVLSSGANPKRYIHAMCDVAETVSSHSKVTLALAMADKASLRQRVELLLQEQAPSNKLLTVSLLILTSLSCLALNVVKPMPEAPQIDNSPAAVEAEAKKRLQANPFPGE